ncbi:MAG: DUF1570 domain-containing protein [Myxococcota bacterium]
MSRLARVGMVVLALCVSACAGEFRQPRSGWLEVQTPHFSVKTSLPRGEALKTAAYLEQTRAAMLQAAWNSDGPPGRIEAIVFARSTVFSRFVASYVSGENYGVPGYERIIVFAPESIDWSSSVAAHELAHQLSSWYMPVQPSWLAEGLASFLTTVRVDKRQSTAYVGAPERRLTEELESNPDFDTASLFAYDSPRAGGVSKINGFYSQAWLLVRYLIEEHPREFVNFQRSLATSLDWRQAFALSMPPHLRDPVSLDRLLAAYWADRDHWIFAARKQIGLEAFESEVRPLSSAAVHGLYSWLLFYQGEAAEREADEALRLDPHELTALRTKLYRAPTMPERAAIARVAVAAHPQSVDAWLMMMDASTDDREITAALERAQRIDVLNPRVQAKLGLRYMHANKPTLALPYLRSALHRLAPTHELVKAYRTALAANP